MASLGWHELATWSLSGNSFALQTLLYYESIQRTNNQITVNNYNTVYRAVRWAGSWNSFNTGYETRVLTEVPRYVLRQNTQVVNASTYINNGQEYWGNANWHSMTVGPDTTSIEVAYGFRHQNNDYWRTDWLPIPALGAPSGTTSMNAGSASPSQLGVRNDTTSWGANATSGSVRSYIADNSSFSGQSYKDTSDNALVIHTGLTSNKRYWFRGWSSNGGGKSAYHSSTSGYTLPLSCVAGTPDAEAVSATIPVTQNNGGGAYTITKQYRLMKTGDTWGAWTDFTTNVELTSLLPSTEYQVQLRSTTSAGTTEGGTTTFTTLPAAKLVMPNGTVLNAIPRVVYPNGTVKMVKVKHL